MVTVTVCKSTNTITVFPLDVGGGVVINFLLFNAQVAYIANEEKWIKALEILAEEVGQRNLDLFFRVAVHPNKYAVQCTC